MRQKIAAGNWKMHKSFAEGLALAEAVAAGAATEGVLTVLAVPFIHLQAVAQAVAAYPHVQVAAQNCHQADSGAYTGEISASMAASAGASHVVLGHSERREYFAEGHALLAQKVDAALAAGLVPIFCCGEALDIRKAGTHVAHVAQQIRESLFHLDAATFGRIVIAYEPIWAIGTGETASPEQAQEMHAAIRQLLADHYGSAVAEACPILYGGSVKPGNARELFGQADVDGGLVGGASLNAADFIAITHSF